MGVKRRLYHYNNIDFILMELPAFSNHPKKEINIIYPLFYMHISKGLFWFRIFGWGLHFNRIDHMCFSERNRKTLKVFKWRIKILKKNINLNGT